MKKSNILLIIILSLSTYLKAQEQTEVRDHYTNKVIAQFVAIDLGLGALNTTMGYGFQVDGFIKNKLSYTVGYTTAGYSDLKQKAGNDPAQSDSYQHIKPAGYFQANVHYHLLDKMLRGKAIREDVGSVYTTVYSSKTMVRKILALRGGVYNWKSGINPEADDKWYLSSNTPATEKIYTTLHSSNLTAGLSYGKVVNASVGGRIVSYYRQWFADVLSNTSTKLDNNKSLGGTSSAFQIGMGNLTKESFGWRVGWEYIALGRKYIVAGFRIEGGQRPGITNRTAYYQVTLGLGTKYTKSSK